MRQIVLDTETTGLYPDRGDRIVEIAAIELCDRVVTERRFHRYINPERDVPEEAARVHGLTWERLQDEPLFADIAPSLLEFIKGAEIIAHNAPFDVGFINSEFARLGMGKVTDHCPSVIDTLKLAKELHPGKKNNLDALCDRYFVDNSHRTLHGALLDTELLGEVYLAMTRGQDSLLSEEDAGGGSVRVEMEEGAPRIPVRVLRASDEDEALHRQQLADIDKASKGKCLWLQLEVQS
jgi:DNA polymerase-3 subunit epsilon